MLFMAALSLFASMSTNGHSALATCLSLALSVAFVVLEIKEAG